MQALANSEMAQMIIEKYYMYAEDENKTINQGLVNILHHLIHEAPKVLPDKKVYDVLQHPNVAKDFAIKEQHDPQEFMSRFVEPLITMTNQYIEVNWYTLFYMKVTRYIFVVSKCRVCYM